MNELEAALPISTIGHLIALKLLARDDYRPQDSADLRLLALAATRIEISHAGPWN